VVVVVDRIILKRYVLMNGEEDPDFAGWYQWLQRISIILYLIVSVRYYREYRRYAVDQLSFAELVDFRWLRNFLVAFGILTALPLVMELLQLLPPLRDLDYVGSWYYFFAFSIVVYYIAINGYHAPGIPLQKLHFEPTAHSVGETAPVVLPGSETITGQPGKALSDLDEWKKKLDEIMQTRQSFTDPELTLSELARQCQTNPSQLSRVLNTGYESNFNDYVNDYRVNALMDKLRAGEHRSQTLLGLAFDCGFNSKATFNRAFKKKTGLSPREWIAQNLG
jgi:AraC-like DNA-binding protein